MPHNAEHGFVRFAAQNELIPGVISCSVSTVYLSSEVLSSKFHAFVLSRRFFPLRRSPCSGSAYFQFFCALSTGVTVRLHEPTETAAGDSTSIYSVN